MESLIVERKRTAETDFSYEICLEHGFDLLSGKVAAVKAHAKKICIVADSHVAALYLDQVRSLLEAAGYHTVTFVFPAGEEQKNLETVRELYCFLIREKFERKDLLAALGGGVTGDLTGYAAATYLRGIDFVQIPTTLLAQVDSSVGGKTGVDFDAYKNMVGAFHQPRLVYMNMDTLKTLPEQQFISGMGEVLKTGLIRDRDFYEWLLKQKQQILGREPGTMARVIRECCRIKAAVVEEDPQEQGLRAILNLGHTIGHAVEKLMNFQLLHGQCVGIGTVGAAWLSMQRGWLPERDYNTIIQANQAFGLPDSVEGLNPDAILKATKSDKKMEEGRIKFVLLKGLGNAVVDRTVTDEELRGAIRTICRK